MGQEARSVPEKLEQLRQRLEEFRSTHALRTRLPESLWVAATELAKRHGMYQTARALHLDYAGLKKANRESRPGETKTHYGTREFYGVHCALRQSDYGLHDGNRIGARQ